MISIRNTILLVVIISLLLSSVTITLQSTDEIDVFGKNFGEKGRMSWRDHAPYIRESSDDQENISRGYYSASAQYGIEPGRYTIDVKPTGENITLFLKDGEKTIEKNFNESISFEMDISTNVVWIGILIRDPLTFQEHVDESFEIDFVKEDDGVDIPLITLWSLTSLGVIYLGIDTYRKKFD